MKIVLAKHKVEARNGYLNIIDKEPEIDDSSVVMEYAVSDYLDFTGIVEDGEADEVFIPSLLEYIPQETMGDYIKKWVAITAIGGTITIGGVDILELVNSFSAGKIDENQLNIILYANNRKGCYSAHQVRNELQAFGLVIEKIVISADKYLVQARRVK